jgi:Holliday junction DNA helicase RuvA
MISHIEGTLKRKRKDEQLIEVGVDGVWYEVRLPHFVWRAVDEAVTEEQAISLEVFYYASERQPKPLLVGFQREIEREFFKKFIQVEDIGPTKAIEAMSMSTSTIARAIEMGDVVTLRQLKGIGPRTADKIVATLRGKVTREALLADEGFRELPAKIDIASDVRHDAVAALEQLGFKATDARKWVEQIAEANPEVKDVEQLLKLVLQATVHS